jgi:Carboxypeptidase regulatory-like domain
MIVPVIFLLQGIPVQQGGKVTGVLRDNMGNPLEGVRIAALSRGGTVEEAAQGAAMAGLAQTDAQGRFALEDIPPGRYSIAAGRLDLQTYHPGTQSLADASVLTITAGQTISGINFVLNTTSFGRATGSSGTVRITATIPVRVVMERGGKLPVFAEKGLISLRLESTSGVLTIPIDGASFVVQGPVATDFRIAVEDLPDSYEVKSITYGSRAIPQGIFPMTAANFPTVAAAPVPIVVSPPPSPPPNAPATSFASAFNAAYEQARAALANSYPFVISAGNSLKPAATPPSTLTITLGEVARSSTSRGVRVSGKNGARDKRVYMSGRPGIVFSDGTFEFRDVSPGRYVIASVGSLSRPFGTVVVVGDKNVEGIELKEAFLLPDDVRVPKDPMPAAGFAPGTLVPLARLTGTVIEEVSKVPITEGEVVIRSGDSFRNVPIDSSGRFEASGLLPGTYNIRLQIFGHTSVGPTVVVEDREINLEVTPRRLY